jgi:hypothetical protein
VVPPPLFFVFLAGATAAYLALVELTKVVFYRVMTGRRPLPEVEKNLGPAPNNLRQADLPESRP